MDKNTITGFVLIGLLLLGFNYFTRPSEEQIAASQRYNDSIEVVNRNQEALNAKQAAALAQNQNVAISNIDSTSIFFDAASQLDEKFVTLENDVMKVTFSTKGGRIYSSSLKNYQDQGDAEGNNKKDLVLFEGDENVLNFNFYNQNEIIRTKDLNFTVVNQTDSSVTMRLVAAEGRYIDFDYSIVTDPEKGYLVDFKISSKGMQGLLANNNYVDIDWVQQTRRQERGVVFENRLSCLTYRTTKNDTERLSDTKTETVKPEDNLNWIAYRSQFFATVLISDQGFESVVLNTEAKDNESAYVKDY